MAEPSTGPMIQEVGQEMGQKILANPSMFPGLFVFHLEGDYSTWVAADTSTRKLDTGVFGSKKEASAWLLSDRPGEKQEPKKEPMTPREYLDRYKDALRTVQAAEFEVAAYRSQMESTPAPGGGTPVQASHVDRMGAMLERLEDLEDAVQTAKDAAEVIKKEVEGVIATVPDPFLQSLLRLRYIDRLSWNKIARQTHYAARTLFDYHDKALLQLKIPQ